MQADSCSQQVLASLLAFLHRHASESGVVTLQLATIFAPLLLRSPQWQSSCLELHSADSHSAHHILDILIAEAPEITRKDRALARASPPHQPSHTGKAGEPQLKVKLTAEEAQPKTCTVDPGDNTRPAMLISPDASPPTSRASCMDSLPAGYLSAYRGNTPNLGCGQSPPVSPRHATSSLSRQSSLSSASVVSNESSMDGVLDELCCFAIQSVLLSDGQQPGSHPGSSMQHREDTSEPMECSHAADCDSSASELSAAAAAGPSMQVCQIW